MADSPPDETTDVDTASAGLDVDAILARIGVDGRREPSREALGVLQRAWIVGIPFENLDVVLGRGIALELPAIEDKLIRRGRGGYCFEHVSLFVGLLRRMGWDAHLALAAIVGDHQPDDAPDTHATAIVQVDGDRWLCDVGFGSGPLAPLPLRDGARVGGDGTWAHRLAHRDRGWELQTWRHERWTPTHVTTASPARPAEVARGNDWVSTQPGSPFVGRAVLMRQDEHERSSLVDHELRIESPVGDADERRILSPAERADEIERRFRVHLSAEERAALR